jgi:hypothetical protein
MVKRIPLCVIVGYSGVIAQAEVPRGWQWVVPYPLGRITATASSEQKGRWPASKAVDGDTGEDDGLWLTSRDDAKGKPASAWLELKLEQPRRIRGVNIYHQLKRENYRSLDYGIACWINGQWKQVAHKLVRFIYEGVMNRKTTETNIGHSSTQRLYDEYTQYLKSRFPGRFDGI